MLALVNVKGKEFGKKIIFTQDPLLNQCHLEQVA